MSEIRHRLIMLKPMRPGVTGYARVQSERGQTLLQVHARGLSVSGVCVFWYAGGGEAVKLGAVRVNAHSEASLTADAPRDSLAPERLQALIVLSDEPEPFPLLIGLCAEQSAGSVLDAKNAALALCDRLSRSRRERIGRERQAGQTADGGAGIIRTGGGAGTDGACRPKSRAEEGKDARTEGAYAPKARADAGGGAGTDGACRPMSHEEEGKDARTEGAHVPKARADADGGAGTDGACRPKGRAEEGKDARTEGAYAPKTRADAAFELPREIFLPAIDPLPYVTAATREDTEACAGTSDSGPTAARTASGPQSASSRKAAPPADRLSPLIWPRGFERLKVHFDAGRPRALFDLPGWRFVQARGVDGLWIGILPLDGRVRQVAYAHSGAAPEKNGLYRPTRGLDGRIYQVLWQRV